MKKLIYYRKDGAIVHHHMAPKEWDEDTLKDRMDQYNADHPERPAEALEVEDGSLVEYLLEQVKEAGRRADEAVQDVLDALETARDCVTALQT